jgi:hypothetical protein
MKYHLKFILPLIIFFCLASCLEKETTNPEEVYKYWSGNNPEKDMKIIHGKYWQSAHWTREYEMYLELVGSPLWLEEFIKQNKLKTANSTIDLPDDAPSWFNPKLGLKAYIPDGFSQGSIYFVDLKTGYLLCYEIQL